MKNTLKEDLTLAMTLKIRVSVVIGMLHAPIRTYIGMQLVASFGELMESRKGSLTEGGGQMLVDIKVLSTLLLDYLDGSHSCCHSWGHSHFHTFLPLNP